MNSTQIRALSAEILLALDEKFECEFSDDATDTIHTVGAALNYLQECNRPRAAEISLAKSAGNYWLKSVKFT